MAFFHTRRGNLGVSDKTDEWDEAKKLLTDGQ